MAQPLEPGWYPDPSGAPRDLFWDGATWQAADVAPRDIRLEKPMSQGLALTLAVVFAFVATIAWILVFSGLNALLNYGWDGSDVVLFVIVFAIAVGSSVAAIKFLMAGLRRRDPPQ
jgi:hypothetical protein